MYRQALASEPGQVSPYRGVPPTSMPVAASASSATSGVVRSILPSGPVAWRSETTPCWYQGRGTPGSEPPPVPPPGCGGSQDVPSGLSLLTVSPQPVSHSRVPWGPMPSDVPPTPVVHGSPDWYASTLLPAPLG